MELPQDTLNGIIGLSMLFGVVQCFFGYRIFKIILGLMGFLIGGVLAAAMGFAFTGQEIIALLSGLVGGIIGAALMLVLYFVGIFLLGAFLGGVLGTVLFAVAESYPVPAVLLILAVVTGVIALIFQKFMIIVATGFGGAWSVVTGIAYFTTGAIDPTNFERMFSAGGSQIYIIVLCWIALGTVGVVVQYLFAPPPKEEETPPLPQTFPEESA